MKILLKFCVLYYDSESHRHLLSNNSTYVVILKEGERSASVLL